ncbi:hypothetical protein [Meiothermus granaticius]|uniref:Uncharacterized protein n=1 Tax=Meiothermus granaticius NBRC 107808 TaxID=1227551 RepID=A0A399F4P0_9DEIN|nr:hypothetical protein [Meiothermus granaticius]RIH91158.1 hypothetical protein Mgrana_02942 [Meiothermus granaticius NBRC 107808]GEM88358.1 hypothetical protein MGR01S_29830 [Meiothermus granaticius NBRC 107808]
MASAKHSLPQPGSHWLSLPPEVRLALEGYGAGRYVVLPALAVRALRGNLGAAALLAHPRE